MDQPCSQKSTRSRGPWGRTGTAGAAMLLVVFVTAACYSYQPVDGPAPVGPETVRVELTGAGEDAVRERRGFALERFEGRILEENGDALTMEVRLPANRLAYSDRDVMDTVQVLRPHIRTVDVKQFSTGRTVVGVGAGLAALAGVYAVVEAAVSSTEEGGTGNGGGTVVSVIPWVTTVLGWLR